VVWVRLSFGAAAAGGETLTYKPGQTASMQAGVTLSHCPVYLIRLANTDISDADWNNFLLGIASKITGESSQELPSEFVQ
jgi:hypothetical protein